jgi:type IV pilus assembly protein PilA
MLEALRKRADREDEKGFTLIELMVVVLIIAILIAIAIPTFLGARERSQNRQAQSNLRNAFAAEKVVYTDNQSFTTNAATLSAVEPSLSYTGDAAIPSTADPKTIYIDVNTTTGVLSIGARSKSGDCFYMRDSANAPTQYTEDTDGTCDAPSTVGGWTSEW